MRHAITRIGLAAAAAAALTIGCYDSDRAQGRGGNSNWLRTCRTNDACGTDLSCVCGICTRPCDGPGVGCDALSGSASCVSPAVGRDACDPDQEAVPVCALTCESRTDCTDVLGESFGCESGRCADMGRTDAGGEPHEAGNADDMVTMDASLVMDAADAGAGAGDGATDTPTAIQDPGVEDTELAGNAGPLPDGGMPFEPVGITLRDAPGGAVEISCEALRSDPPQLGDARTAIVSPGSVTAFDVTADALFFAEGSDYGLYRADLDGSNSERLADLEPSVDHLRADAQAVVWTRSDSATVSVFSVDAATGERQDLSPPGGNGFANAFGLALTEAEVYWMGDATLVRSPREPGSSQVLATADRDFHVMNNLRVNEDFVYYIDGQSHEPASLHRVPSAGGTPTALIEDERMVGLEVDGDSVYFSKSGTRDALANFRFDGRIARLSIASGEVQTVVLPSGPPHGFTLHDDTLYYFQGAPAGGSTELWRHRIGSDVAERLVTYDWPLEDPDVPRVSGDHVYWVAKCGPVIESNHILRAELP
jgi:hypothetical protein